MLEQISNKLDHCVAICVEGGKQQAELPTCQDLRNTITSMAIELSRHGGVSQREVTVFWFDQVSQIFYEPDEDFHPFLIGYELCRKD